MENKFGDFVNSEMKKRGWGNNELARKLGYSGSWVSAIITGKDAPSVGFCVRLSKVYDEPVDKLLTLAGLLEPKKDPPKTRLYNELVEIGQRLDERILQEVVDFARYKLEKKAHPH